jgi:hypothetical protein
MKGTERLQKHVITQIDHSKVLLQKMKGCVCVKKRLQHVSQRDTSKVVSLSEICEESPKNANHTDLLFVTGQIITYNKNKSSICQSLRTFNNIILSLIKIHTRFILRLFVLRCRILLFPKTYYQNMIQYIYIYDNANIFSFFFNSLNPTTRTKQDMDFLLAENVNFSFFCKPYLLKLQFPGNTH